jgi:hypothetical protein
VERWCVHGISAHWRGRTDLDVARVVGEHCQGFGVPIYKYTATVTRVRILQQRRYLTAHCSSIDSIGPRKVKNFHSAVRLSSVVLATVTATATAMAFAAPADAASGTVKCPSSACVQVASGLGAQLADAVPDNKGSVYVTYGTGVLQKVVLATGSLSTVASGLGNLRGVAIAGRYAYVVSFDGTIQKVTLSTGAHRTLATGLPPLFGVARNGDTTYVTDEANQLVAVPDGGSPHVVATVGFSEGIAFDASGAAYTASMGLNQIVRTNVTTGATQVLATEDYEPTSISVGKDGQVYFLGDEVERLNPTTGVQTDVTEIVGINPFEFSLATSGDAYAADGTGGLWEIKDLIGR